MCCVCSCCVRLPLLIALDVVVEPIVPPSATVNVPSPDTTTVPVVSGNVIVLSAVGSVTCTVVSKLSAVLPSKTMLPPTVKLVTLGLASKAISISLFETVVVMFDPELAVSAILTVELAKANDSSITSVTVTLMVSEDELVPSLAVSVNV